MMEEKLQIKRYEKEFSVCKVKDYSLLNLDEEFVFTGRTDEESSLVCCTEQVPKNTTEREDGFKLMRVQGVLDFSLIGILSRISTALAESQIGIFVISTFHTDYILVKAENYDRALKALEKVGFSIVTDEKCEE